MALDQLSETDLHPKALAESYGKVFAEFDARTQDSGNVSYGVAIKDKKFFMKQAMGMSGILPELIRHGHHKKDAA